jgi:hypothetical protein
VGAVDAHAVDPKVVNLVVADAPEGTGEGNLPSGEIAGLELSVHPGGSRSPVQPPRSTRRRPLPSPLTT